ncbi:hypothetical protein [Litorilituus lipolyticus]|uniref:hypothetical protein n=1 Tax=Litorilituus lipolyticus TaxID=2491017 RepID=UPI001478897C|nr:hypothetical protein [Litorilituus lipolyticus]
MTKDQHTRLAHLTSLLMERCISETEFIEYQSLSEMLLLEMNHIPKKDNDDNRY